MAGDRIDIQQTSSLSLMFSSFPNCWLFRILENILQIFQLFRKLKAISDSEDKYWLIFGIRSSFVYVKSSLVAQTVNNLPTMQETQVQSLGQEDPLEKEMATHAGILAWEIPWTEEPGGLPPWGCKSQT